MTWHAAYTRAREEGRALENLERQGFESYLPLCREGAREPKPLFPRYIFVQFDLEQSDWGKIRSTRGVVGLLKNDNRPGRVPDEWIAQMKGAEDNGAIPLIAKRPYAPGAKLTVLDGAFLGHSGILQPQSDSERAILAIKMLSQVCNMQFGYDQLMQAG